MTGPKIHLTFAPELHLFLPAPRRTAEATAPTPLTTDGKATLGHVVESLGIPLTEAGELRVDGRPVPPSHVPAEGETVHVAAVTRPQRTPGRVPHPDGTPLRFLLDVHLGTLARRMRLLGIDAAYESEDIGDPALAALSAREQRVLLSRDRGLLHRRELWAGAYVYSHRPDEQLRDVLNRFAPSLTLAPWTRCTACNGDLVSADKDSVSGRLQQGTQRAYDVFAQCTACERVYWRGAHHQRLEEIVTGALTEFGETAA
ncbi:Mut7-C RNAse domain-containing protein [Streptomyces sp. NPDC050504]|uniref:Mut7-C RNAse domain-containing protein n=1 Tax=Streptomyces sp. NPDC050504 TaxID=3365618 RepID=UPI0037B7EBA7